jgi:hypothetical protein
MEQLRNLYVEAKQMKTATQPYLDNEYRLSSDVKLAYVLMV